MIVAEKNRYLVRTLRHLGATAVGLVLSLGAQTTTALAQDLRQMVQDEIPADAQMLLEADSLIFDQDSNSVTASGGVQIEYAGNRLVADEVTYNRTSQRLTARGNVHIVERTGNNIYTAEIDITDDFRDGFVNQLRIETVDKTYFAAESADRRAGTITTFNNGVYTACEPCEEKPDKAAIWRIKARKIIWNGQEKVVRFERASFELFGLPIASMPYFEMADPTIKRKSGFLFPAIGYKSSLGVSLSVPYYFALSPTYDLTVTGTGYSKQGFLTEAEWRQRTDRGEYSLKIAGIHQENPLSFDADSVDRGPAGNLNDWRGMVGSKGNFQINPRWTFGWDVLYQSDKNFSRTYDIAGFKDYVHQSEVYLEGMGDRNYFDLRFMKFQVQEDLRDEYADARNPTQPWVLPSFDYSYIADQPVFGGELNIDVNSRTIVREQTDISTDALADVFAVRGVENTSSRVTAEAEWKRSIITPGGLVVTPILHVQADSTLTDISPDSENAILKMAANPLINAEAEVRSQYFRTMATAGLDVRWPIMFSSTSATHVLEPVAQIFARPNEQYASRLGLPNEDAQSLVFDASSLFERDKFSGYDRIEGGTRANLGFRYVGTLSSGWTSNAIFGQSYHIAGLNSYATPDLVNAGAYSGLETERSDYVALFGLRSPNGFAGSFGGRFDQRSWDVQRFETRAAYTSTPLSLQAKYAFIKAQPLYGFDTDRHQISLGASKQIEEFWRVYGSGTYDIKSDLMVSNAFGIGYDDECFSFALTYSQNRSLVAGTSEIERSRSIGFNLSFRTLGDIGSARGPFGE